MRGKAAFEKELGDYKKAFLEITGLLNSLKPLYKQGLTCEEAAAKLKLPVEKIQPYWAYAEQGEVAIADPRVFPALYFLKGALALNALRSELGDELFFQSFRKVFQDSKQEDEVTLDEFRNVFEVQSGKDLKPFFDRWYHATGLPN